MSRLSVAALHTPFHVRMAARNLANAWVRRGAFTVPAHFGEPAQEALAARVSAVLADSTPYARLRVHGAGAARLLSAACGVDLAALATGEGRPVHWMNEAGGVRGLGVAGRFGETNFVLGAFDADRGWFETFAPRFGARVRDETLEKGLLLLLGPYAPAILTAAGLSGAAELPLWRHAIYDWRGITVEVSRWSRLGGFRIASSAEDGVAVFDRLAAAGEKFALMLAGQDALELLYLEAGFPLAGFDFQPARADGAPEPAAISFGVEPAKDNAPVLAGLEWESGPPAPFAPLFVGGQEVGRTLRSAYSPALRRNIALANLRPAHAAPGSEVEIPVAGARDGRAARARVAQLPFLKFG